MNNEQRTNTLLLLSLIGLGAMIIDRIWFTLDQTIPSWDQADYLNGAMNYWHALQTPQFFNPTWWQDLWLLSSKIPPGTYILTAPFLSLFGITADAATTVFILFNVILLLSVYGLGYCLFSPQVGLIASAICQLLPGLYRYRTEFLLDYPVTAVVTLSFFCLTLWKQSVFDQSSRRSWLWSIIVGISIGFSLMIKQTVILFLFFPIFTLVITTLWQKKWVSIPQIFLGIFTASFIFYPWYRTNWLLILTSGKRATVDSAIAEGDPALNTIDAWVYYGKILPYLLSFPLLIIPIVCFLIYGCRWLWHNKGFNQKQMQTATWLGIFLLGGYFLSSLNVNKDARYILPLLPVLSLIIAQSFFWVHRKWQPYLITGSLGLGLLLMIFNLFPLPGEKLTHFLSPRVKHHPTLNQDYPHQDVVKTIIETSPYLQTNLGVLPSTSKINQHNFSFYGAQANFQVYGRQVGIQEKNIEKDARSMSWFLTKSGDQGSVSKPQQLITHRIETGEDFSLHQTWTLPDRSFLKLYQKTTPIIQVTPIKDIPSEVKLTNIDVPKIMPPGVAIPISYTWEGSWEQLQQGIVLLTWEGEDDFWLHDHGFAMGHLATDLSIKGGLQVRENTAMFLPPNTATGDYTLKATYLDRITGKSYPITSDSIAITVDKNASSPDAPELDLVTQLRQLGRKLSEGEETLDFIFSEVGRINQYDPTQDYLAQAETALKYRLQTQEKRLNWLYPLALSAVLQRDVQNSIDGFKQITQLDANNPYAYAYLAFVYLYDWQPQAAEETLSSALKLNPDLDLLHTLDGVAALMQGNLIKAYHKLVPSH